MRDPHENLGIPGWFARENREVLARLIATYGVQSVVEIGSFMGLSAVWFAQRVNEVHCVDTWYEPATEPSHNNLVGTFRRWNIPNDFFHMFRNNVMRSGVWHKINPIRGTSNGVFAHVPLVDLVYVDGDHGYEGCKRDIDMYLAKARKVICGDDYVAREGFGVIEAVSELLPNHEHHGAFWWAVIG